MTDKTPNYTDAMVTRLHAVYNPEDNEDARVVQVAELADELNKKPASIIAKLTREGVYVAKAKVELRDQLVSMTITATERMVKQTLDQEGHRKLIAGFIDEMQSAQAAGNN